MSTRNSVAVADDLFTWPAEDPRLIGARCGECAAVSFPRGMGCPRCGSAELAEALLASEGSLWTWTTQDFLPKEPYLGARTPPETFRSWCVGLVELGEEIRVEGRLVDCDATDLTIGQRMRTVVVPFATDEDGNEVLTFAFAPVVAEGAQA